MDVHDTALIPRTVPLEPGMILTLEPGIYIPQGWSDVPEEFRGSGVRIEDDILIESDMKVRVLSKGCPSRIDEVELLAQGKS
jgi:Xaa-Pro aminopeptidase